MSHWVLLLLEFSSLWQINVDGLGAESLKVVFLGFVERRLRCFRFFRQLWGIFALISLTCALCRASLPGIPHCVLGGESRASEAILFSVLFFISGSCPTSRTLPVSQLINSLFFFKIIFLIVYVLGYMWVYMYMRAHRGQKTASGSLELVSQVVVGHPI